MIQHSGEPLASSSPAPKLCSLLTVRMGCVVGMLVPCSLLNSSHNCSFPTGSSLSSGQRDWHTLFLPWAQYALPPIFSHAQRSTLTYALTHASGYIHVYTYTHLTYAQVASTVAMGGAEFLGISSSLIRKFSMIPTQGGEAAFVLGRAELFLGLSVPHLPQQMEFTLWPQSSQGPSSGHTRW